MPLSQRSLVAKGMLAAFLRPRLACDTALPNLDPVARLLGKKAFDRREAAGAIRRVSAGLLANDADVDDVPEALREMADILDKEKDDTETGEDQMDVTGMIDEIRRLMRDLDPEARREVLEALRDDAELAEGGEDRRRRLGRDGFVQERVDGNELRRSMGAPSWVESQNRSARANDLALDAALARYERNHPVQDARGFASRYPDAAKIRHS
jgi:hypothetical protein